MPKMMGLRRFSEVAALAGIVVLLTALGLAALVWSTGGLAMGQGTTLSLGSVPPSVAAGGPVFNVEIQVAAVTNLGAYEWQLRFDPAVVEFVEVTDGPFLGSTGRSVSCPSPIMDEGSVRFGCATLGLTPLGPSGSGVLSTVSFQPVADGSPNIQFVCAGLADPLGEEIPVGNVPPCVAAATPTPYGTPPATDTPTGTPTPTNTFTPSPTPSPTPNPSPFSGIISAGASSATVLDGRVGARSHITVTLTSDPRRSTCRRGRCFTFGTPPAVSWIEPMVGQGFVVHLTVPVGRDTTFAYSIQTIP